MVSAVFVRVYVRYVGNLSAGGSLGDLFCDFMKTLNNVLHAPKYGHLTSCRYGTHAYRKESVSPFILVIVIWLAPSNT